MCELHIEENTSTEYPCLICEDTLPSKPDATQHLTKHFGDVLIDEPEMDEEESRPLTEDSSIDVIGGILCCFCDELYKTRIDFDLHFVTEHGDKELVYTCIVCNKKYDKYSPFANHYYFHLSKDKFE
ncbi:zinc finger protein 521-like [Manduca sexta]|nr:zinc finger protein 521-like [Manduca sexta]